MATEMDEEIVSDQIINSIYEKLVDNLGLIDPNQALRSDDEIQFLSTFEKTISMMEMDLLTDRYLKKKDLTFYKNTILSMLFKLVRYQYIIKSNIDATNPTFLIEHLMDLKVIGYGNIIPFGDIEFDMVTACLLKSQIRRLLLSLLMLKKMLGEKTSDVLAYIDEYAKMLCDEYDHNKSINFLNNSYESETIKKVERKRRNAKRD